MTEHPPLNKFDTLTEFHLQNPDCQTYELIEQVVKILKEKRAFNHKYIANKIKSLLGNPESRRIWELICRRKNINYSSLFNNTGSDEHHQLDPKLLLHLCLLESIQSSTLVAAKLGISLDEATHLIDVLKHTFTLDEPLIWLENFILQTKKERDYCNECKQKLMNGREIVNQPVDTREERRLKMRKRFASVFRKWW